MKRSNLIELINTEEKWFRVNVPVNLHMKILGYIGNKYYTNLQLLKIFKMATITLLSLLFVLTSILTLQIFFPARTKVVYVYPYSGTEKEVYIITKIHKEEKKIPLVLDEDRGIWKAVFHTHNLKSVEDIELLVEEFPSEEGLEE